MITKLGKQIIAENNNAELRPYQQRVLDRLMSPNQKGLIAYHSTGAGKTLTALRALEKAKQATGKRGLFVVPASLVNNAKKEISKHGIPLTDKDLDILSYEKAVRNADTLMNNDYGMAVFDEAHRLRNTKTNRVQNLRNLIGRPDKALLLTGTAGYNGPSDIPALVHLLDPSADVPKTPQEFEASYVDSRTGKLRNLSTLKKKLAPYVDVYERPMDSEDFPQIKHTVVRVPMSDEQTKLYQYLERKLPIYLRNAVRNNIRLENKDAAALNTFSTGIRQASLSTLHHNKDADPHSSTKLTAAVNRMYEAAQVPNFKGVAYSNYIDAGINPYATLLKEKGIEPLIFTGGMNAKQKKALVDEYNSDDPKPKVLLVSSSGGEGLDLKGTRRMQILEPHFNDAKIEQVRGRGARYLSHAHLPKEDRNLLIEEFQSTMPKKWYHKLFSIEPNKAIDGYLYDAAQRKATNINELKRALTSDA